MISTKAKIMQKALALVSFKKIVSKKIFDFQRKSSHEKPPKFIYRKYNVREFFAAEMKCFTVYSTEAIDKHIIYFHGGAYSLHSSRIHWKFIDSIIEQTKSKVTFFDYPLAPKSDCVNTLETVKKAYKNIIEAAGQEIILMGDSAGGGMALALSIAVNKGNIMPKPSKVILLSAWLDISMEGNDYSSCSDQDFMLDSDALKKIGRVYAGDLDIKDYRCSPIYDDLNDMGKIAIFTGTKDMLNVQSRKLRDKLINNGYECAYYEYEDMQHIWMLLPIPEAQVAVSEICKYIIS